MSKKAKGQSQFTSHCKACTKIYKDSMEERKQTYDAAHYEKNKEAILARQKIYRANNKDKIRKHKKQRYENDPGYRMEQKMRGRMYSLLKNEGNEKSDNTKKLVGCESTDDLIEYLYSKSPRFHDVPFLGEALHVDHIVPCAVYDLSDPRHQKACFHFTNLQFLTPKEIFNLLDTSSLARSWFIKTMRQLVPS